MNESYLRDAGRLKTLQGTGLMDSLPEAVFDRYVRLAAALTGAPTALVSLVDDQRQFFKAQVGLPEPWASRQQTPLTHSFCQHVVTSGEILDVGDARSHPLVRDNLAVTELGVESYLGAPLQLDGERLGSLCVIDGKSRKWSDAERQAMQDLADAVNTELELRQRNEQLQAERDLALGMSDALSEFMGRAGHELRTPLQGILLSTEMAGLSSDLDAKSRRFIDAAYTSAQSMRRLIDDILQLHRLQRGLQEATPIDINLLERFRWLEAELAPSMSGRKLEMSLDPAVEPLLTMDWSKVHRLLVHLISNALRYTSGAVMVRASVLGDRLLFEVSDQGEGLTPEQSRTVFEPFARLQEGGGSGLGLPISRRLARVLGGSLRLASKAGEGCTFRLDLPYQVAAPAPSQEGAPALLTRRRVLVVDDHALNLELFETMLTSLGQEVATAPSGAEALRLLETRAFDLILMDLQMPGLSGYETLAQILLREGMKVVAMSAGSLPETFRLCREAGFHSLLPKPVSRQDLMRLLLE